MEVSLKGVSKYLVVFLGDSWRVCGCYLEVCLDDFGGHVEVCVEVCGCMFRMVLGKCLDISVEVIWKVCGGMFAKLGAAWPACW